MAGFLTGTGVGSYAGVNFPVQIKTRCTHVPVYDTSGRMVKYIKHVVTIEGIIHDYEANTSDNVLDVDKTLDNEASGWPMLKRKLCESGRSFVFTGKGLGSTFSINTSKQDVCYGPAPRLLDWTPAGDNKAVHFVWQCEVHTSPCDDTTFGPGSLCELTYEMAWDIDENGLTYRTVNGTIEIPARRTGSADSPGRGITDTADKYRNKIKVVIPVGYKRAHQSYHLSRDKRTLEFSIRDEEIPSDNPYYPGVIRPDVHYEVVNENLSMAIWVMSLQGTITVAQGKPRWWGWAAAILILESKMRADVRAQASSGHKAGFMVATHVSFSEDIFSRSFSFSFRWRHSSSLDTILQSSGVWEPVTGTTWEGWRTSMEDVTGERGVAGLAHNTDEDYLVTLCSNPGTLVVGKEANREQPVSPNVYFRWKCPPAENSWLSWFNEVTDSRGTNTLVHNPLVTPEQYSPQAVKVSDSQYQGTGGDLQSQPVVQRYTQSSYRVRMRGYAMRVGFPIPKFELIKFGGKDVVAIGKPEFRHMMLGQYHCPIYVATWDGWYYIKGTPKGDLTQVEPNPFIFKR